jgi:hypothetical protein
MRHAPIRLNVFAAYPAVGLTRRTLYPLFLSSIVIVKLPSIALEMRTRCGFDLGAKWISELSA